MTEYTGKPIAELTTAEKLEILAAHIVRLPYTDKPLDPKDGQHEFNMQWFATLKEDPHTDNICGTICCVGGEAVRLFDPAAFKHSAIYGGISEKAEEVLGITHSEAHTLFSGYFSAKTIGEITPEEAAEALLELAGKYKVAVTLEAAAVTEELNK